MATALITLFFSSVILIISFLAYKINEFRSQRIFEITNFFKKFDEPIKRFRFTVIRFSVHLIKYILFFIRVRLYEPLVIFYRNSRVFLSNRYLKILDGLRESHIRRNRMSLPEPTKKDEDVNDLGKE